MLSFVVVARVLDDAFAYFKGQVQTTERRVTLLEIFDDAQGVQIVVKEEPVLSHSGIQSLFARVPEWRVPDVVYQGKSFRKVYIKAEGSRDGARNLGDFERMRQAIAEVIGVASREHLRLSFQAAESSSVNNAIAVTLKVVAVGMVSFRKAASPRLSDVHRVGGEHEKRIEEN